MYFDGLARSMATVFIVCIVCAVLLGIGLAFAVPWLWSILKPLIHGWTA